MGVLCFGTQPPACSTTHKHIYIFFILFYFIYFIFFFFVSVPHPPRNLTIEKVTSNSVLVHWEPPLDSIYSEYSIR